MMMMMMIANFLLAIAVDKPLPPVLLAMGQFPWPDCTGCEYPAPNCPLLKRGADLIMHHTPAAWCSKMLSESFWKDRNYPRKSRNSFHRNTVFFSAATVGVIKQPDAQFQSLDALPHRYPEDTMTVNTWIERNRLWDSYRQGWYRDAKTEVCKICHAVVSPRFSRGTDVLACLSVCPRAR